MGRMIDGVWRTDEHVAAQADGTWERTPAVLRDWVTRDGQRPADGVPPGAAGETFPAETGRYHVYGAINCPWAHRIALTRAVLGLEDAVGLSNCAPRRTDQGWVFDPNDGFSDDLHGAAALHEIYARSDPNYSGRVTTPVLWDRKRGRIVSNESADILRMMTTQMMHLGTAGAGAPRELYPAPLRVRIDELSDRVHGALNNGVYRAGFAGTQAAYETAAHGVFAMLDTLETRLADQQATPDPRAAGPFLFGSDLTESDLRLFPTLVRFDVGYHSAFKCNLRRLVDYPHLWAYARRIYRLPGVADTVDLDVYRRGYNSPSPNRNPLGIVPIGPEIDWLAE